MTPNNPKVSEYMQQLETVGYCRIPSVYSPDRMREALKRVNHYYEATKNEISDKVPFLNIGQPTLYNLQNKDPFFLELLFEPKMIQEILIHFLNDQWFSQIPKGDPNYILRSFIARSSNAELPMHLDSFIPYLGSHVFIMQYSIILEAQNEENGCTVVVPGSHHSGEYTTQEARADAVPIESEVGDLVMWDSRLWHGTTENQSSSTRWAIVATFCRWWMKQHWQTTRSMPQEIFDTLTPQEKAVLGFCSIPHFDESAGIDIKSSYEQLPPSVRDFDRF